MLLLQTHVLCPQTRKPIKMLSHTNLSIALQWYLAEQGICKVSHFLNMLDTASRTSIETRRVLWEARNIIFEAHHRHGEDGPKLVEYLPCSSLGDHGWIFVPFQADDFRYSEQFLPPRRRGGMSCSSLMSLVGLGAQDVYLSSFFAEE